MKKSYDFIVLGLGGIGSAALYWLTRSGAGTVLGLEQYSLGHEYGASQDHSRIIRLAYDDAHYTRLTPFTFIHWRDVEAESGVQLVFRTGSLVFSPETEGVEPVIEKYAQAMRQVGLPYERLTPSQAMAHFPQFQLKESDQVIYCANDGFVDPGKANAAHTTLARARGATIMENTPVKHIRVVPDGVEVETSASVFKAARLVITTSGWTNNLLSGLGIHLPLIVTEEQVTYFAAPNLRQFSPERFPVWIYHGEDCFYGFPVYGEVGTKAGQDVGGDAVTVETRKMQPNPRPFERLSRFLSERIPGFLGPVIYTKPCIYTMPPDRNFILDTLPGYPQIALAVGAGHGFKFASLLGRILSDLAVDGKTVFPIDHFSLQRPAITDPNFEPLIRLLG